MKTYKIPVIVSDELLSRLEKLAAAKGTSVKDEVWWAVTLGVENHMVRNLDVMERWEAQKNECER